MSEPDDGITLGAGTDISVSPDELAEEPSSAPDPETTTDDGAMGGTGGGNAGGAG